VIAAWWVAPLVLFLTPIVKELFWPCPRYEFFNFCVALACWAAAFISVIWSVVRHVT